MTLVQDDAKKEFFREEIAQKFVATHNKVKLGINGSPCTASFDSFKIEKSDK